MYIIININTVWEPLVGSTLMLGQYWDLQQQQLGQKICMAMKSFVFTYLFIQIFFYALC